MSAIILGNFVTQSVIAKNMKKKDLRFWFLLVVLFIAIYFLDKERRKNKELELRNALIRQQRERLRNALANELYAASAFYKILKPSEQIQYIINMIDSIKPQLVNSDPDFANSADDAIHNLKGKKLHLAFGSLFMIIEQNFKIALMEHELFTSQYSAILNRNKYNNVPFGKMLDFAKENELISLEEFDELAILKDLRNICFHEISDSNDTGLIDQVHTLIPHIQELVLKHRLYPVTIEETETVENEIDEEQLILCD